jgi:putative pyrroloquinoline-quinone binding quinoprotein
MTTRDFLIAVGTGALILDALILAFAIRAMIRRRRAGRPRVWVGLVLRGLLIAVLLAVGASSLTNVPPPPMVNHPNPAAGDATIAFLQTARYGNSQTVIGVGARDGATRWTRTLDAPATLLRPLPDAIIATSIYGVSALRASDGALLWQYHASTNLNPNMIAADGARVVALTLPPSGTGPIEVIALSLATGAAEWRFTLPASLVQARGLAMGDGRVFVEGWASSTTTGSTTRVVMALRATDGAPQWTQVEPIAIPGGFQLQALFIIQGYIVVVPTVGPVTALRESDGATAWTATPNLEEPDNPPQIISTTADSATIYMVWEPSHWATGADGRPIPPPVTMTAMAVGGTIRWHMTVQPASSAWSSLAINDGVLLSGNSVTASRAYGGYSANGSLLAAYDAASGRLLWRDNTPRVGVSWDMSPEISPWDGAGAAYLIGLQAGSYYIQDRFNCVFLCSPGVSWLYAVNVHTGAPWWRIRTGSVNLARPFFVY